MSRRSGRHIRPVAGLLALLAAVICATVVPTAGARAAAPGHTARGRVHRHSHPRRRGMAWTAHLALGADHAAHTARAAIAGRAGRPAGKPAAPAVAPVTRPTTVSTSAPVVAPAPAAPAAPVATPAAPAIQFYDDPQGDANVEENELVASGQTQEAAEIEQIAGQPQGIWLTSDSTTGMVPGIMSAAAKQGTVPIFVLYNLPWRDCGGDSSGGASDPADYDNYVNTVAADLGQGRAYVIVEPDALSELSCLPSSEQQDYDQMIGYAAQQIDKDANASVYIDAGNPTWQTPAYEAAAIQTVLGSNRGGFELDTSNFVPTATDIAYGTQISQLAGGRHFVVDTSRNGAAVPSGVWCNPPSAGLGANPTSNTGNPLVDALLWVKRPGESDGDCNGAPVSGQFWLAGALALIANR